MKRFPHKNGTWFKSNDADIYYEVTGDNTGRPLLLLHGGMLNIESFNGMLSCLPDSFYFIGMDSRGHGASTFTDSLSYHSLCQDVEQLLAVMNVEKIDIIAHSDGGVVAMKLAESRPELVNSLVLIGAQWCLADDDPAIKLYESMTPEMWIEKFNDDVDYYNKINKQPRFNDFLLAVKEMWLDQSDNSYPKDKVKNIQCETLIIRGDDDFLVPCDHAVQLAEMINHAHFANIPFCNHSVHEENPALVSSLIMDFYQKRVL